MPQLPTLLLAIPLPHVYTSGVVLTHPPRVARRRNSPSSGPLSVRRLYAGRVYMRRGGSPYPPDSHQMNSTQAPDLRTARPYPIMWRCVQLFRRAKQVPPMIDLAGKP